MVDREALSELATGLHRKLLNTNQDYRRAYNAKYRDASQCLLLKATRKALDRALSVCNEALKQSDPVVHATAYKASLAIYQQA